MADEIMKEKVYCYNYPMGYNNDQCGSFGMAMLANQNNQWQNNPFAYMMIMGMMRFMYGDNWQNGMGYNTEINSRFNQLSTQLSDNHNTDIINEAVKGNTNRIGELANNLNVDLRAIQSGLCDLRSGIQQVAGETKFSAERVINAANMGDTNIIMALKDCCCQNKELVQRMGYENQISQRDLTAALQAGHTAIGFNMQAGFDRTNTGLERAAATVAFEAERNKCQIIEAGNANTQRIIDTLNGHWNQELQLKYQDAKLELSQQHQNAYLLSQLKNNGCGC